jgi:hypothetical protein
VKPGTSLELGILPRPKDGGIVRNPLILCDNTSYRCEAVSSRNTLNPVLDKEFFLYWISGVLYPLNNWKNI